ncbi:MAG: amidohydrolase [Rhodospirillaceae bacterium]|jgi:predicted amidohydrolase YtcJ|nr:amidohydrolase [Rhodospirillaceae bacterium]MBT6202898.1 amidohydrolase [Rhodospirillaceae bacterium]MBT6510238.1 amidohydrolase [Rhodospirillaceae bacterium]MBT7648584.1 amidohydrolase [Rhodospirillaceae bacterium]
MPAIAADLILKNGRFVTLDAAGLTAEAVACWNGRILAVGSQSDAEAFAGPKTHTIDLGGQTVIPGLIDSHCHPDTHAITTTLWHDVKPDSTGTIDELLTLVKSETAKLAGDAMFLGWGWNDKKCGGYPTIDQLDQASPDRPVYIGRTDGHIAIVNSAMLRRMDIADDATDPPHGAYDRDPQTGRMTGLLREATAKAIHRKIYDSLTPENYAEGLKKVFAMYHRHGVTSLHNSLTRPMAVEAYQMLRDAGDLTMRMGILVNGDDKKMEDDYIAAGIRTGFGDEWIKVIGIEWCPDCSTSGRTAAYYEPYIGDAVPGEPVPNSGMLLFTAEDLTERAVRAHKAGLRICIEGVGDRGIDFALDAIEAALKAHPVEDHRSRVEHCCYVTPELVERLKRLGVTDSSATGFMYDLGDAYVANRGDDAMAHMWPHRALIDAGVPAPGHSDAPVCGVNPWQVFWSLVNRTGDTGGSLDRSQAITVTEALQTYTTLGAWTGFEEDLKGTIETGKLADFAVLKSDPWSIETTALRDVDVAMTLVGGEVVYES